MRLVLFLFVATLAVCSQRLVPPGLTHLNATFNGQGLQVETQTTSFTTSAVQYYEDESKQYFHLEVIVGTESQFIWTFIDGTNTTHYLARYGHRCTQTSNLNNCSDWYIVSYDAPSGVTHWSQDCTDDSEIVVDYWIRRNNTVTKLVIQINNPGSTLTAYVFPDWFDSDPPQIENPPAICAIPNSPNTIPQDCAYSWGSWSTCTTSCGGGLQMRLPVISISSSNGGVMCPEPDTQSCNTGTCTGSDVDCDFTWSDWSTCSSSCGTGWEYRYPLPDVQTAGDGIECPIVDARECNGTCDQNCNYTWSNWSNCTSVCGGEGMLCPLPQTEPCNTGPCTLAKIDCLFTWSNWTDCNVACGKGVQWQYPLVTRASANGGVPCPVFPKNSTCDMGTCPTTNSSCTGSLCECTYTWSTWTNCSAACSGGTQMSFPIITTFPTQGNTCPLPQSQPCNTGMCTINKINCVYNWTTWSVYDPPCGLASRYRIPVITQGAANGGTPCPSAPETQEFNFTSCDQPVNCIVSWDQPWSNCSNACGTGNQNRSPTILLQSAFGGIDCPSPQSQICNTGMCTDAVVNCTFSWSDWTQCSPQCNIGSQNRIPMVTVSSSNGGTPCPEFQERPCYYGPCGVGIIPLLTCWTSYNSENSYAIWRAYFGYNNPTGSRAQHLFGNQNAVFSKFDQISKQTDPKTPTIFLQNIESAVFRANSTDPNGWLGWVLDGNQVILNFTENNEYYRCPHNVVLYRPLLIDPCASLSTVVNAILQNIVNYFDGLRATLTATPVILQSTTITITQNGGKCTTPGATTVSGIAKVTITDPDDTDSLEIFAFDLAFSLLEQTGVWNVLQSNVKLSQADLTNSPWIDTSEIMQKIGNTGTSFQFLPLPFSPPTPTIDDTGLALTYYLVIGFVVVTFILLLLIVVVFVLSTKK